MEKLREPNQLGKKKKGLATKAFFDTRRSDVDVVGLDVGHELKFCRESIKLHRRVGFRRRHLQELFHDTHEL